jgi:hypothetical protein
MLIVDLPAEHYEALLLHAELEGITINDICQRELSSFLARWQPFLQTPPSEI